MLKNLPEEVLTLWNYWEIRGMVLLSLLLQTILIICGPLRKTIARFWIRILVWSAYLSADMVATVALGNLARSQGDSSGDGSKKANNSIQAFWAPFLLLHLGGPDTITAYSIEDNELWLRHLLCLVVQVGLAFYVFSRSWGSGILPFIAIPMFIVGIIKYSERTWVLWSSCSKSLRNSLSSIHFFRVCVLSKTKPKSDEQREYLREAYTFFHISKFTMQDLVPSYFDLMLSHLRFSKIPADGAFKVVEVELGLIYDMLYTKAPLIYSCSGIILRCISFLLSVTAFIIFQVKIEKHAYSPIDVAITYLLLAASVFLELYAFLRLVLSDLTMIWLLDKGGNALTSAIYSRLRKLTTSKRWSRCISQYNLISSSIGDKQLKCLQLVGIDEMMRQSHVKRKGLKGGLQNFIFEHLRKKAEKMKKKFNLFDNKLRSKIIGQRGDGVLEREGLLKDFKWCTTEVEFSRSILVWHLATEICYGVDKDDASNYASSRSKCLSEYMMYLLVIRPNMLPKGFGDEGYLNMRLLRDMDINQSYSEATRYQQFQSVWKTNKYTSVDGGPVLARQLVESIPKSKKRREVIEDVWMEMLSYAAAHCPWKEHSHALRRGGELLTHVSFLMLHLGLSQQYEYNPLDNRIYNSITNKKLKLMLLEKEERDYYRKAINKYYRGIKSSTPDEEELQKAKDKCWQVIANLSSSSLDKEELQEAIEKYVQVNTDFSRSSLDKEELQEAIEKYVQVHVDFSRSSLDKKNKKEELQKARDKYLQVIVNLSSTSLNKEELQEAIVKYVQVHEDFSRSILDKEVKQIIADKDQELERFRASLTASTPQQGIDSLPRSLPAQTDSQGTGQLPLKNNEISLCMN